MQSISIIVRTRNEERWIGRCLRMLFRQDRKDFEVILVDNRSTDNTLAIARKFPVKTLSIDEYRPGHALNAGIRASSGRYVVCLSAHCLPVSERWLSSLLRNMEDERIAGVYGRQLPMSCSSPRDKRDLLNTFGLDHRIQVKDTFFHNANSMIRRSVWERHPFDDKATNIEDRIWGKTVIAAGHKIAYEPEAAVYHYHGIHQDGNEERARNVVRILESLMREEDSAPSPAHSLHLAAVLPVLGPVASVGRHDLLQRCLRELLASGVARETVVISENAAALKTAKRLGVRALERPASLLRPEIGVEPVLQYALRKMETGKTHYDGVLYVNYLFPFRPAGFFERMAAQFAESGVESLVPALPDFAPAWSESEGRLVRRDAGFLSHQAKHPIQRGLVGLGTITTSDNVRQGRLLGESIALAPLDDKIYAVKANDPFDLAVIRLALERGVEAFGGAPSPVRA